jgi:recombination protein RecA
MAVKKTKGKASTKKGAKNSETKKSGLSLLQAKYGMETVRLISDKPQIPRVSTELIGLDELLGGGLPTGRIIEIYGHESSGKTTVAITIAGSFQRAGYRIAVVDVEQALDPQWCKKLGCDIDNAIHVQPQSGEVALQITNELMKMDAADLIIVDSVAALVTQQELEKDIGEQTMGQQAKLMSTSLKQLIGSAASSGKTIIFINQMRKKIGGYGNPDTTSGGEALKYYSSIRLEVRRAGTRAVSDVATGNDVRIKAIKNKTYRPYVVGNFYLNFKGGYDKTEDLINCAIKHGVINLAGSWISYKGDNLGQGKPNTAKTLNSDKALYDEIYKLTAQAIELADKDDVKELSDESSETAELTAV